ncbi:MAG: succinylglutamate desuccinylase/aspartoacylase family protein [Saprospiraceae bacterium]|nr:succinylglutamate desuccinylase/aspartoacylase family protein [Saprospiraceae bacterium]
MSDEITINNRTIKPGESGEISLHVGRLPSGARISIKTHVFNSEQPGPTMLVLAGLHGDEINGMEIVRRALSGGLFEELVCGRVVVMPVLNVYGFINFSREVPDGKDVNRSFPGNYRGSLAARVARMLTKKVLPIIDFGVDFHTGGDNRFNFPQIRYSRRDDAAEECALQFAAPFIIEKPVIAKTLRKTAKTQGTPIIVFEGGEALRLDGFVIESALKGLRRLLHARGMLEQADEAHYVVSLKKTSWIRASHAGIFIWSKKSGTKIQKGETLGAIFDPYGATRIAVTATRDGYIIGHNNTPVVHQGDALFHLGYESEQVK